MAVFVPQNYILLAVFWLSLWVDYVYFIYSTLLATFYYKMNQRFTHNIKKKAAVTLLYFYVTGDC